MSRLRSGLLRCLLAAVVAVVLLPRSAAAQAATGTISGTVLDQQGQVIPGATVTVTNEATNEARVTVSDVTFERCAEPSLTVTSFSLGMAASPGVPPARLLRRQFCGSL